MLVVDSEVINNPADQAAKHMLSKQAKETLGKQTKSKFFSR